MNEKPRDPKNPATETRKPYVKPELKRMNGRMGKVEGAPAVPGPPVAAQASPVAPGAKVF